MLVTPEREIRRELEVLAERLGRERAALIPMLQEVKRKHGYVPDLAMQGIADLLGIHPSEVYGVVTFYSFLNDLTQGRFVIRLCRTVSCDLAGKAAVARQLENDLGIRFGETTRDGYFTLEWASCLGMCDRGPALLVNERVFPAVTPHQVDEIIAQCRHTFGDFTSEHETRYLL
jgi:NADH:ubiquinone oxidoreductase subunit E